ncbi:MAG: recombinase family protein [Wolbachia sp.]
MWTTSKVENDPESKLSLRLKGLWSEYETTRIMERSRRGKLERAKDGCVSVITVAPYGYNRIEHVDRDQIKIEINEEEAKIVRQIFIWIGQERVSIREVIRRLRDMSVRTRSGKKVWCPIVIWKMLKNPAYKGLFAFGKSKRVEKRGKITICRTEEENWIYIPIPKIIDEGLFNKVQKQLGENKERARIQREGKKKYLLQSLVVCQNCKYAYSGAQCGGEGEKISYYRCSSTIRITDGEEKCNNKSVRTDMLEMAVWEQVKDVLKNPEMIRKEYQRRILENKSDESLDKKLARRENQIKEGIEKLMEDYYSQGEKRYISEEEFKQAKKILNERLKGIEEEKKKVTDRKAVETGISRIISSLKNFYSSIKSNLERLDWQTKRGIVKALIERIRIDHDQVEIGFQIEEPAEDGKIFNLHHCTNYHDSGVGESCQVVFVFNPF